MNVSCFKMKGGSTMCNDMYIVTHTHTHTTILWPSWILSRTTRVSQKVKPIWIYWSKR